MNSSILLIYTGGTIGMKLDPETGALMPFNFNEILIEVPEILILELISGLKLQSSFKKIIGGTMAL